VPVIHQRVGQALYHALTADPPGAQALTTIRNSATSAARPLDIVLRFAPAALPLAALPWELLWDAQQPLLLSRGKPASCVRYLDLAQALPPPRTSGRPLRILAVRPQAGIPDTIRQAEHAARHAALSGLVAAGTLVVEELRPASLAALVDHIQQGPPPDILHFYGHGRYQNNTGALLFDAPGGGQTWVDAARLTALLGDVRLVMLHACQSAMIGAAGLLTGIAPALSAAGVPAVIAMQLTVRVAAATRFAGVVYRVLAQGASVQRAVSLARQALYVEEDDGASWYVPTLTLRTRDRGALHLLA
jgi:CHAT domain-containing protein